MSMMRVVVAGKTEDYRKGLAGQKARIPVFKPSSPRQYSFCLTRHGTPSGLFWGNSYYRSKQSLEHNWNCRETLRNNGYRGLANLQ